MAKLVITWWHNENVSSGKVFRPQTNCLPGSSLSQMEIAHFGNRNAKPLKSRSINNNHKLSDRNEGEGRFGNHARPPAYAAPPNSETKTDPFTVKFTSDGSCIGSLIRVICWTNLSETNRFHSGLASGQLEITRTNFSLWRGLRSLELSRQLVYGLH